MIIINHRKAIRFSCITCMLVLAAWVAYSQPRYLIQHFTNEQGLSGNSITGLEWDEAHQLLWVGTNAGITRWNGQYMTPESKVEGRIRNMCTYWQNGQAYIYATSGWESVYRLVNTSFEPEGVQPDNQLFIANNIARERNSPDILFNDIDKKANKRILPPTVVPLDSSFRNLLVYFQKGIYLRWNGKITRIATTKNEGYFFRGKEIWLIDGTQISIFNTSSKTFRATTTIQESPLLTRNYTIIENVNTPLPFVYADGKLYNISQQENRLQVTLLTNELPKTMHIKAIRRLGNTGNLAIGDLTNGIYLLRRASILPVGAVSPTSSRPPVIAYGQVLMQDGQIMTSGNILMSRNQAKHDKSPLNVSYNLCNTERSIYSIDDDSLYQYNKLTRKTNVYRLPFRSHSTVYAATEGKSYAITQAAIYELLEDGFKPVFIMPEGAEGQRLWLTNNSAVEFRKGIIAIGGDAQLTLFNTHTLTIDTIPTIEKAPIRAMWRKGEYFFMGTYGKGIFVLKNNRLSGLPLDKQQYLKYTHCFRADGNGYLYLSSNHGLFKVSEKAFLAAADHPTPLYYHYLGQQDGLATTELNGGCAQCSLELPDGTLSFPSMNGLAWLQPDSVLLQPPAGIILVDKILVDSISYDASATKLKALPNETDNINFSINIPYWGNKENIYAWYRLQRLNSSPESSAWISFNPTSQQDFSFSSLKAGDYQFEVAVINGYETGDIKYLHIPFSINYPWYLKWYFMILWMILLATTIIMIVKWRTAQINQRTFLLEQIVNERTVELNTKLGELAGANQLQERLISVVSHNIIAPLRYLHDASASLKDGVQSLSPAMQQKAMASIVETAQEMELLAINLLNWIRTQHQSYKNLRPEYFHISEIMERVYDILYPLAQERGLEIILDVGTDHEIHQYKDALQVILYNLTLNAVLYSEKGSVKISYTENSTHLKLCVADEGKGISPVKVQKLMESIKQSDKNEEKNIGQGFGYQIIKETLILINGTLEINSEEGSGTTTTVYFDSLDRNVY